MQICKVKNYQELSRKAANLIAAQIILKPDSVLGLATGSSPVGTYDRLVEMYQDGDLDFSEITTVNLDEYKGLSGSHEQSYRYFMNTHLFHRINISYDHTYVPDGTETDSHKACQAYNELLHQVGPADLQILGLGHDGHIGFNEPSDHFEDETHCVDLTETTIQANKRFFASEDDVPRQPYRNDHALQKAYCCCQRQGQSFYFETGDSGTSHTRSSRIHPSVPSGLYHHCR